MNELLSHFGVDWTLLLAQTINFFVLFFVLKLFVFAPVAALLRKRREDIERGIALKKQAEEQVARSDEMYERKMREADQAAFSFVAEAEGSARLRREEIIAEAAKKSAVVVEEAKRTIREEKAKMREEFGREARSLMRDSIVAVLAKIPPKDRDRDLIERALSELKSSK